MTLKGREGVLREGDDLQHVYIRVVRESEATS